MASLNAGQDAEKLEHSPIVDGKVKLYSHSRTQSSIFKIILNMQLLYDPGISVLDIYASYVKILFSQKSVHKY